MELPEGVKAVWDLDKAYREATGMRERVCINGLWRWQPADPAATAVPEGTWGYFKVPGSWPGSTEYMQRDSQLLHAHPNWADEDLQGTSAAWYQREITVPREWAGRRITLCAEWVNSHATVYVDGKEAGAIVFPGGELDITPACRPGETQTLSMLVLAMPLKAVMLSYSDTASARQVEGQVARRGLCGDVYLAGEPPKERIGDVRVDTSVRNWNITFDTALDGLEPHGRYTLRAEITEDARPVTELAGEPFTGSDLKEGRISFTAEWQPEKLWDIHTPQNQYEFSLSLLGADGSVIDASIPERFGFREFWIDGRDFYLNGTRVFLSSVPLDNAQMGAALANYDAVRESLRRLKSFGINFVYTHNYGCQPGAHLSFEEALRAADDEGMLISFSQPHFGHYDWDDPNADETNGYARHAEFYAKATRNHPSVVFYSTSHNATGYAEDMNPDTIDAPAARREEWSTRNVRGALRAEAIINRLDPRRIVYHHSSGSLSSMHTINFYANFVPIQEMCDWFEHWSNEGVMPVFTCEYTVPLSWDWTMYRGWYKGQRAFGRAAVPWELCIAEWNAQFFGASTYQISEEEKTDLRWEAEQFRAGRAWRRQEYPYNLNSDQFAERYPVYKMYFDDVWPAFRTWGLSANSPWFHGHYWRLREGVEAVRKDFDVDWENLQQPGLSPDYAEEGYGRVDLTHKLADWEPTVAARSLIRHNMPLLAYIAGKPAAFTSKDHNFLPGETVEKQIIVINNSRVTVTADCQWSFKLPPAVNGTRTITLPTGEQERIPLTFELPANLAPGQYTLTATVSFSNGETQEDSFAINVLPAPQPVQAGGRIALFDPKGETAALLDRTGVDYQPVDADAELADYAVLVIGKGALTVDGASPDISAVRDGLKVIIFEQTGEVLERRFGFRIAEYGLRWVSERVPDHPLLAGLDEEHLRDWRGDATSLPPRLDYELSADLSGSPAVKWCDIPVTRLWRCGNRGNVASALIEKPACGDFLPILDGGYSLQYTPLAEYREGEGMVLFCQVDVTGRTEADPAAETLARNVLQYVSDWKPAPRRAAVYVGGPAGKAHLESAGLSPAAYAAGSLSADQVLVVGPGGAKQLAGEAPAIADWLKGGGHVLAVGLDAPEVNAFLPLEVSMERAEHIAAYFEPAGAGCALAGISPAEVHNRDPRELPLVSAGATVIGNGVLATAEDGRVVLCQLVPWEFDYSGEKMNIKRTFRRVSCLTTRLLANMGAPGQTRLLEHVSRPVAEGETRWLDGLYLDVPEEWDDPYRFFRW